MSVGLGGDRVAETMSIVPAPASTATEYRERVLFLRLVEKLWVPMLPLAQRWVGPPPEYRQVDAGSTHLAPLGEDVTLCGRHVTDGYIDHGAGKPWLQGLPGPGLCQSCKRSMEG